MMSDHNEKPMLPALSQREIYALSHPQAPDFESEMMVKSFYEQPKLKHAILFSQAFFDMHENFPDDELANFVKDHK